MKTLLLALFATAPPRSKYIPLQGRYLEEPYVVYSEKSFDEVWDNVVDVVATMGFPIKLLDKQNGLLVCERMSLLSAYSQEDKAGRLKNPDAYVVVPNVENASFYNVEPYELSGVANVRIRAEGKRTKINVNLNAFTISVGAGNNTERYTADLRSTGRFEQGVAQMVE